MGFIKVMKMLNVFEGYPFLREGNYIHLFPLGGSTIASSDVEDPLWRWMLEEVNGSFIEIISLCNGTRTVEEIIETVCKKTLNKDREAIISEVQSVLELAYWRDVICFQDKPKHTPVFIYGNKNYYVPVHMCIEVTTRCNFRCKHCYRESGPLREEELDYKRLKSILPKLAQEGLRVVEITGGEPLLHPKILSFLKLCASNFDIVSLLTNGYYVNEGFVEEIRSFLKSKKLIVSVTINSSIPDFHDEFTGVSGAWKHATRAVRLLSEAGALLRFTMNITPDNMNDLEDTVTLAMGLGATAFAASPIMPFGRGSEIDWTHLSKKELFEFENRFNALAKKYKNFFITVPEAVREKLGAHHCGAGFKTFALAPNGTLRPCVNVSEDVLNIGNIFNDKIESILANPIIEILHKLRSPGPKTCHGCEFENFCQLCWYRGLVGSQYIKDCPWLESTGLIGHVDEKKVKEIAMGCNLKTYHSIRSI